MTAKTIFQASPARGESPEADRSLCWQTETAKGQPPGPYWEPNALIPRPRESRSLIPMGGKLRELAKEWVGRTWDPFLLVTIKGICYSSIRSPLNKTYPQVWCKGSKDPEKHDEFRGQFNAI